MATESALSGRAALVTGGASGIGAGCVRRLADEGVAVTIADLSTSAGADLAAELTAAGQDVSFVPTDVTDAEQCELAVGSAAARRGRLDIVVAAAGISHGTYLSAPEIPNPKAGLLEVTDADWRRVMAVNVDGILHIAQSAGRRMIADGTPGSIVTIASMNSQRTSAGTGPYSVSKAAAWMLTKSLAVELAPHRIRVNAVGPGFIETPMTARMFVDADEARAFALENTPLGRFGQPSDIAAAVRYLVSDEASFVTGTVLYTDGGYLADVR